MTHTITALDGTGASTVPTVIEGFAPTTESGNEIHEMIAPGAIAVTLVGDLPRAGSLTLYYGTDAEAESARLLLGRACAFSLVSASRPVVNMVFVRAGAMSPAMHDSIHGLWVFEVGYQETP